MKQLGLIGRNISYSFSKKYFEAKFRKLLIKTVDYSIFDIKDIAEVETLFQRPHLVGFNVTIPYKVQIIKYLDALSAEAEAIGAVNTVAVVEGKKIGYNTDAFGFEKTLNLHQKPHHHSALIFGDGGAAQAVKYVLNQKNIPYQVVSRAGELTFENLDAAVIKDHPILIQCTPVGTFPNVEDTLPLPLEGVSDQHLAIDLIYNPEQTQFLKNAAQKGAKTANGLLMLEQQAEKAWEIWNLE
ncbi:shikimate dehydrogenase family protein [Riemerella columbina]|uniref:shikimate dehydrogenase family protein n=1 Tax=Riemerella columbina TaxID=103810 RepID=UPI00266EC98A|nr:shikimate dehydrogenase [Riemerella columbina]WKS95678.1 shikimate dehydrogenase [Riemerella columbina]